jgi:hypothetical protein
MHQTEGHECQGTIRACFIGKTCPYEFGAARDGGIDENQRPINARLLDSRSTNHRLF